MGTRLSFLQPQNWRRIFTQGTSLPALQAPLLSYLPQTVKHCGFRTYPSCRSRDIDSNELRKNLNEKTNRDSIDGPEHNGKSHQLIKHRSYVAAVWIDVLCIAIFALITLGIHFTPVYRWEERKVPIWPSNIRNEVFRGPSELQYPHEDPPLPSWACGMFAIMIPLIVSAIFQIFLKSLSDFHAAFTGLLKALVATSLICTTVKHFIGGFRPHYIDVCGVDRERLDLSSTEPPYFLYPHNCTAESKHILEALRSFPSGHASSSFASATFLAFYLNAKLKTLANHSSHFWVFVITIAPLMGASFIAGLMYISRQHHAHDLLFGIFLGFVFGTLGYRSAFAAIIDPRYNHIPLPPFSARTRLTRYKRASTENVDRLVLWRRWMTKSDLPDLLNEDLWFNSFRSPDYHRAEAMKARGNVICSKTDSTIRSSCREYNKVTPLLRHDSNSTLK